MSALAQIQAEVLEAVRDVHRPVPRYVEADHDEKRRTVRFNIYRNNFYVAVINVLRERFPVTERIVGEEFFKAMARDFVQKAPPLGQSNLSYGRDFPAFLENFPPCADLPYLPDVSRIEWARFEAAIAPDMPSVTSQHFHDLDPARAALVRFKIHPACRILQSTFPVYDIWRTNHEDDEVKSLHNSTEGQAVLVSRTSLGIEVHQIGPASFELINRLSKEMSLGQAFEELGDRLPQTELSSTLSLLLTNGAITTLVVPDLIDA